MQLRLCCFLFPAPKSTACARLFRSPRCANVPQALRRPILTPLVGSSRVAARAFATEVPPTPESSEKQPAAHAEDIAAANDLTAHLPANVSFVDLGSRPTPRQIVASRGGK